MDDFLIKSKPASVRYYGEFDDEGAPKRFWASDVFPPEPNGSRNKMIPSNAVEITQMQWQQLIEHQSFSRFQNGKVTILPRPTQVGNA